MENKVQKVINITNSIKNGCIARIVYSTEIPVNAYSKACGVKIIKVTSKLARIGVNYHNIKTVINSNKSTSKHSKNNYSWVTNNRVLYNSNTDKNYLRIAKLNGNKAKVQYFIKISDHAPLPVSENSVREYYVNNSYFNKKSSEIQNIGIENIIEINGIKL